MSVLLGDRKESKFEAITYSIELHDMLILLMQRGFGVKDVDSFVRKKYAYGEISEENFAKYRELMRSFKSKVNQCASLIKYVRQQKFYGRYMDDWYIMNPSKEELENLLENVCKIAAELGIHINRKKTRIVKISSKYKFLQIKYTLTDTGKVIKRINPDRVTAMRRKLKKLAVKVENEEADYDNVENMFRGWMGGHYKLLSREQRKNLIQLYEDLFSKEITIVNKKLIVSDRSA